MEAASLDWTDLNPEDATAHILSGASCLISGAAGTGKSTLVKSIIEELRKSKPVALISKTHVAADNMSLQTDLCGMTADAWTQSHPPWNLPRSGMVGRIHDSGHATVRIAECVDHQ